jgi:hypothetical protein
LEYIIKNGNASKRVQVWVKKSSSIRIPLWVIISWRHSDIFFQR